MNSISLRFKEVLDYLVSSGEVSNNKDFASKTGMSTSMITEICKGRCRFFNITEYCIGFSDNKCLVASYRYWKYASKK